MITKEILEKVRPFKYGEIRKLKAEEIDVFNVAIDPEHFLENLESATKILEIILDPEEIDSLSMKEVLAVITEIQKATINEQVKIQKN